MYGLYAGRPESGQGKGKGRETLAHFVARRHLSCPCRSLRRHTTGSTLAVGTNPLAAELNAILEPGEPEDALDTRMTRTNSMFQLFLREKLGAIPFITATPMIRASPTS